MKLSTYSNTATSNLIRYGVRLSDLGDDLSLACGDAAYSACILAGDCLSIIEQYENSVTEEHQNQDKKEYLPSDWLSALKSHAYSIAFEVIQNQTLEALEEYEAATKAAYKLATSKGES